MANKEQNASSYGKWLLPVNMHASPNAVLYWVVVYGFLVQLKKKLEGETETYKPYV